MNEIVLIPDHIVPILKKSELFRTIETDSQPFLCPARCYETSFHIESPAHLDRALDTFRYWGLDAVPIELGAFLMTCDWSDPVLISIIAKYIAELKFLELYKEQQGKCQHDWITVAFDNDHLEIVFALQGYHYSFTSEDALTAAQHNNIEMLRMMLPHCDSTVDIGLACIAHDHLEMLKLAFRPPLSDNEEEVTHLRNEAAVAPNPHCSRFLHSTCCKECGEYPQSKARSEKHLRALVQAGRVDCIQCLYEHDNEFQFPLRTEDWLLAAQHLSHPYMLMYLHQRGVTQPWQYELLVKTIKHGSVVCVEYLHDSMGVPEDAACTTTAVRYNQPGVLQFYLTRECPLADDCLHNCAMYGDIEILKLLWQHGAKFSPGPAAYFYLWQGKWACVWHMLTVSGGCFANLPFLVYFLTLLTLGWINYQILSATLLILSPAEPWFWFGIAMALLLDCVWGYLFSCDYRRYSRPPPLPF